MEGDGHYSVKSAYDLISGLDTTVGVTVFSKLWKACAPSNAVALGWRVLLDRLQTKENLARRNIPTGNLSCPWCGSKTKSTSHLLFTCGFAWKVWTLLLRWLNLVLVLPDEPSYHFAQFVESCSLLKRNALSAVRSIVCGGYISGLYGNWRVESNLVLMTNLTYMVARYSWIFS